MTQTPSATNLPAASLPAVNVPAQFGQYAPPLHTIAHVSDIHLLDGGQPLYGAVDTEGKLAQAMKQLERSGLKPEAIVFTGDLADLGEPDAYRRLRAAVEPVAERMGATVIWVMGNHDERAPYSRELFDGPETDAPQDRVYDLGGLRVIAFDSTVPGYHHGDIDESQLDWLTEQLATPAPHGTLIALHHPPIPSPIELMAILELRNADALARVIRGTDVIGILAGHLHYSTHATFAGIPVSVAAATCNTIDVSAPAHVLTEVDGAQSVNIVQVYEHTVVHSTFPLGDLPYVTGFDERFVEALLPLSPEERLEAFSNKNATVPPHLLD